MEDKRFLLTIVLMIAIWLGFSLLFPQVKNNTPIPEASAPVASTEQPAAEPAPVIPAPSPLPAPVVAPAAQEPERDLTIDTPLYRLVFNSHGGRLKTIELKKYQEKPGGKNVFLLNQASEKASTLAVTGDGGMAIPADLPYHFDEARDVVNLPAGAEYSLRMWALSPQGVRIDKTIQFQADRYTADVAVAVTAARQPLQGRLALELATPWDDSVEVSRYQFIGPQSYVGEDLHQDKVKDITEKAVTYGADTVWTGFTEKYFMTALVPLKDAVDSVVISRVQDHLKDTLWTAPLHLDAGGSLENQYMFFFGPKAVDVLNGADHSLKKGLDFGIFAPIAEPLLHVLKFFYRYLGNYGLAIILLTCIIKLLFWPLTHKSYSSMKAMQRLQPKIQQLREKYKSDKQRLNSEMMALYKEHRVNPMGGCLPMLVQIPVFFALYRVLLNAIELRQAPFAFWIHDLSAADPYYITPLVMGATMFLQQKLTPSTADPTQAKVMMLMPLVFTFLFINFPAGLVVYWLVNNLLSIWQQLLINRAAAPAK